MSTKPPKANVTRSDPAPAADSNAAAAAEAPRTAAGRALAGWVRPTLRTAWEAAIGAIEAEAGRAALTSFRDRIAGSSSPASEELLTLIDQALADRAAHPDA